MSRKIFNPVDRLEDLVTAAQDGAKVGYFYRPIPQYVQPTLDRLKSKPQLIDIWRVGKRATLTRARVPNATAEERFFKRFGNTRATRWLWKDLCRISAAMGGMGVCVCITRPVPRNETWHVDGWGGRYVLATYTGMGTHFIPRDKMTPIPDRPGFFETDEDVYYWQAPAGAITVHHDAVNDGTNILHRAPPAELWEDEGRVIFLLADY